VSAPRGQAQHHPFWNAGTKTWTDAKDLKPGTTLKVSGTGTAVVTAVRNHTGAKDMRDLTVATIHTYYVVAGNTPVLVHNCGGPVRLSNERIDTHILPHHGPGTPASGTKFHEDVDPARFNALANEAVSGSPVPSRIDSVTGNHAHDHDFGPGRVIGEGGSTKMRVWVDQESNVRTMHPL
jgi:hypothetical protein